jgi:UDP-3-O-[3-hydroxymyristoyl] glucosamine N-acyltransferase
MNFDRTGLNYNIPTQDIVQIGDERSICSTDINHKLHQYKHLSQQVLRISVEQLFEIEHSDANFIVTVENRELRKTAIDYIVKKSWNQISVIMENCTIMPDVTIEHGVVVFPLCVILSQTIVDDNVLIYPGSCIGHLSHIGNNTIIQGGCFVGGTTKIGQQCTLGLRSTVATQLTIPPDSVLGSFSSLTKSPESSGYFLGIPARKVSDDTR